MPTADVLYSVAAGLLGVGVGYGMTRARIDELERQVRAQWSAIDKGAQDRGDLRVQVARLEERTRGRRPSQDDEPPEAA